MERSALKRGFIKVNLARRLSRSLVVGLVRPNVSARRRGAAGLKLRQYKREKALPKLMWLHRRQQVVQGRKKVPREAAWLRIADRSRGFRTGEKKNYTLNAVYKGLRKWQ